MIAKLTALALVTSLAATVAEAKREPTKVSVDVQLAQRADGSVLCEVLFYDAAGEVIWHPRIVTLWGKDARAWSNGKRPVTVTVSFDEDGVATCRAEMRRKSEVLAAGVATLER